VADILAQRDEEDRRPVLIMAQDEGRFGRINQTRAAWSPPTLRPKAPRQIVRQYLYLFAAVCPSLGKMTALILPFANTEMMNIFLEHVAREFKEFFVLMLTDQAGWHTSNSLKIPENIRLLPQPPHSPELNPAEHLWDEIKEKYFANKAFKSLDQVEDTLCLAVNDLASQTQKLKTLTNYPFLQVTC